jgi:hypothetical protein
MSSSPYLSTDLKDYLKKHKVNRIIKENNNKIGEKKSRFILNSIN